MISEYQSLLLLILKRNKEKKGVESSLATNSMCDHDFVLGCMFKNRLTILTRIQFNSNFSDHGASDMLESREREAGTKASQKKYFQILIMRRCKGKVHTFNYTYTTTTYIFL